VRHSGHPSYGGHPTGRGHRACCAAHRSCGHPPSPGRLARRGGHRARFGGRTSRRYDPGPGRTGLRHRGAVARRRWRGPDPAPDGRRPGLARPGRRPAALGPPWDGRARQSAGPGHPWDGLGPRSAGLGHPWDGLGHPWDGLGHPWNGLGHPWDELGHPWDELGHPSAGLGRPLAGLGHPSAGLDLPMRGNVHHRATPAAHRRTAGVHPVLRRPGHDACPRPAGCRKTGGHPHGPGRCPRSGIRRRRASRVVRSRRMSGHSGRNQHPRLAGAGQTGPGARSARGRPQRPRSHRVAPASQNRRSASHRMNHRRGHLMRPGWPSRPGYLPLRVHPGRRPNHPSNAGRRCWSAGRRCGRPGAYRTSCLNRGRLGPGARKRSPARRRPSADGQSRGMCYASLRRRLRTGCHKGGQHLAFREHREKREVPLHRGGSRAHRWSPSAGARRGRRPPRADHGWRVFPGRPDRPAGGHALQHRRTDVCSGRWRRAPTGGRPTGAVAPVAVRHATRSRCHPLAVLV
jgi:TatD DNase family protein/ribonuclease G